jgi:hypothetical protein
MVRKTRTRTIRGVRGVRRVRGHGILSTVAAKALHTLGADKLKDLTGYVVNRTIDMLPIEMHMPGGYNFCGPGTKLKKRLARGDKGINPLDESCKAHDIAYSKYTDNKRRSEADLALQEQAWLRVNAPDASIAEKTAALIVTNAIKAKRLAGGRLRKLKPKPKSKKKNSKTCINRRRAVYVRKHVQY